MILKDTLELLNFVLFAILTGLGSYGIKLLWSKIHKDNQLKEKQLENDHKDGMRKTLATVDDIMSNLVPLAAVSVSTPKGQRKAAVISTARNELRACGITDATEKMLSGSAEKMYQRYKASKYYVATPKPPMNFNDINNVNENQKPIITNANSNNNPLNQNAQNPGANK